MSEAKAMFVCAECDLTAYESNVIVARNERPVCSKKCWDEQNKYYDPMYCAKCRCKWNREKERSVLCRDCFIANEKRAALKQRKIVSVKEEEKLQSSLDPKMSIDDD